MSLLWRAAGWTLSGLGGMLFLVRATHAGGTLFRQADACYERALPPLSHVTRETAGDD